MIFYLKSGDTANPLVATLSDANGVVDLSDANVTFRMRHAGKQPDQITKVDASATPDADQTANPGKVRYFWVDDDVDTPGEFVGEFIVSGADNKPARFPNGENYIRIVIGSAIAPAPAP